MEGVHTPTIIRLTLLTDLALIQLKDLLKILRFPNTSFFTLLLGCPLSSSSSSSSSALCAPCAPLHMRRLRASLLSIH